MKYLVAVSGGVDSVVLLHMLTRMSHELIVAHVDHGIRGDESAADARFVRGLAERYGLPYAETSLHLPPTASEDVARRGRYAFLREQADGHGAVIATAHHQDDVAETIAINLTRGTGWRGLAVMGGGNIYRPLIGLTKKQLYAYALSRRLEWVEDQTNQTDAYLRNRIRRTISSQLDERARQQVLGLRSDQIRLRRLIARETERLLATGLPTRHFLTQIDLATATELLGTVIQRETGTRPTRPQLEQAVLAVRTARPGTQYEVGDGIKIHFTPRTFSVDRV